MLSLNNSVSNINSHLYYLRAETRLQQPLWQGAAARHDAFLTLSLNVPWKFASPFYPCLSPLSGNQIFQSEYLGSQFKGRLILQQHYK